jgi:hypothetical protein
MQYVTSHFLRDRKMPWIWPMKFKECPDAKKLREVIKEAHEKKWPELIEKLYEQKLHELRFDCF